MPTVLRANQHELTTEDETPPVALVFGTADLGYLTTTYPAIGSADPRTGDVDLNREDGIELGEDYAGPKTVTFEVAVLSHRAENREAAGSDLLNTFESAWRNRAVRLTVGKRAILRSNVGGRIRRVYGRPRRYDEQAGEATNRGMTPITCDFIVPDGRWYDDEAQTASATLKPPTDGDLIAPLVAPLTTAAVTSSRSSRLIIGGATSTWPVLRFYGPVTNPQVKIGDLTVGLDESIPAGMWIEVDPRPGFRTVLRSDGASKAGRLSYLTPPMPDLRLRPGSYAPVYTGIDNSATSRVEVTWRNAYSRW